MADYGNCERCGTWRPIGHPCIVCMERGTNLTEDERQYVKHADGVWRQWAEIKKGVSLEIDDAIRSICVVSSADTVPASKDGSFGG